MRCPHCYSRLPILKLKSEFTCKECGTRLEAKWIIPLVVWMMIINPILTMVIDITFFPCWTANKDYRLYFIDIIIGFLTVYFIMSTFVKIKAQHNKASPE